MMMGIRYACASLSEVEIYDDVVVQVVRAC